MPQRFFTGTARGQLDDKGRSSLPREFRRCLEDLETQRVYVTIGPKRSLELRTEKDFNHYIDQVNKRPRTPQNASFSAKLLGTSRESVLDRQHRFSLSSELTKYAQITKEMVFVGNADKVLIVNPEHYNEHYAIESQDDFEEFDAAYYWDAESEGGV